MKKIVIYGLVATMSLSLIGCGSKNKENALTNEPQEKIEMEIDMDKLNEEKITNLVEEFGSKLKNVSLLSLEEELEKAMKENYGDYVSDELINRWLENIDEAPGRIVSSPWPDRIEVTSLEKVSDTEYKVEGKIAEVTSVEGEEIKRPITLEVKNMGDKWLIVDSQLGEYEE